MSPTQHYGVAVVGGGPVGMLLAAELGLHGVRTVVLERHARTVDQPKAGTLHARTVQSLARRGYLPTGPGRDPDSAATTPFHFAGLPGLTISAPAVEGRPIAGRSQADLERAFERRARALGVEIRRGHEVVGLVQDPDRVELTARLGDGGHATVTADYAVGADGARSAVRALAGIASDEHRPRVAALLGQVRLLDPAGAPPGWNLTPRGWTVVNVNPFGHSRVITFDFDGPHPDRHAPVTLDELRATASRIAGHDIPMDDAVFTSRFSDFARLARRYRDGRVLLAGDAAHVHFPVGGQGLNLGLQDAFNLAWKLALVVRGEAGKGLLDTYHDERRPAGRRVVDNTRAQLALMRPGDDMAPLRALFTELLGLDQVSAHLGDMISAQETAYPAAPGSPWQGRFLPNLPLEAGGAQTCVAALLHAGRPVVLLFPDADRRLADAAGAWSRTVDVVRARSLHRLPWDALLLRPDGYVAWTSAQGRPATPEDLGGALRQWFGEPRDPAPLPAAG
ncbi:FAD-dependent monooxygenase [Streptomyces sp. CC228A]|uniref:FAD-dependent monooxygenase n=1 Tax=Streptomyces sp. CC228A TaxID=2898186 RepID=UPI001F3B82F8|nr:FAD-dependent monooxygenase [Streptomyces sp. CC228A]